MTAAPFVSICIPVKNGEGRLEACLDSLARQSYPRDRFEVIVADGRSTDRTREIAAARGARVLDNAHQIVASGRNVAFAAAAGEFIASTDDDCILPPGWLEAGVRHLQREDFAAVGGPTYLPADSPAFARAAGFVFRRAGQAGYSVQSDHPAAGEVDDVPGCNTLYRRSQLAEVGEFDTMLLTAEDVDLHLRMRARGMRLLAAPDFFVWHCKRDTPVRLFHQLRRFAIGRRQLGRRHAGALRPLHVLAALLPPAALLALAALAFWVSPLWALAALAAGWAALALAAWRAGEPPTSALLVAPALAVMLAGWSWGFWRESLRPMRSTRGR